MKNVLKNLNALILIIGMLGVVTLITSCKAEDKCETVTCQNGGTCLEGNCNCPEGYTGSDCSGFDVAKVQDFLDSGNHTPLQLYNGGVPLENLYGKTYQGGLIFFVNTDPSMYPNFSGEGMVCTSTDFGDFDQWGCGNIVTGATGTEIGDGPNNTQTILDAMCSDNAASTKLVTDLVHEGYNDWFLPSSGEVQLIYENLHLNGHSNFLGNIKRYQSSTEVDANHFSLKPFYTPNDTTYIMVKFSGDDIRPARTF